MGGRGPKAYKSYELYMQFMELESKFLDIYTKNRKFMLETIKNLSDE